MGMYSKIEMFSFADFYHRFASTGLTMEEMLFNYKKYQKAPRDIKDPMDEPRRLWKNHFKPKPASAVLKELFEISCENNEVTIEDVNSGKRDPPKVRTRQQVSYVGLRLGFEPGDFVTILKWDRSSVYSRANRCEEMARTNRFYRKMLNSLLQRFDLPFFSKDLIIE